MTTAPRRPHPARLLFPLLLVGLTGSFACSGGDLASGPFEPDGAALTGGTSGSEPGLPGTGGAQLGNPGVGGTGGTPTQVVCTGGCEDVPRSSETCAQAKEWGFCGQSWFENCKQTCGTCEGSAEEVCVEVPVDPIDPVDPPTTNPGGTSDVTPLPSSAPQGWASRYWDCCKQHCSWPEHSGNNPAVSCTQQDNVQSNANEGSACGNPKGNSYTCWSMAPWAVSDNLAYGFAAVPPGGACGKCYQLDFTGSGHHEAGDPGSKTLAGKHMIVQATNIGHDVNGGQFDLLIPGGGVGAFNACATQWGTTDLGAQYGGFLTKCNGSVSCLRQMCNATFTGKPELLAGCLFHADWMGGANNPNFKYSEVACPAALGQVSGM
ncbi:MAG TPA: hypothetical protein VLC09_02915 [Polyangiaceae bacterium]|nr:hypothetical protein [Polyangiaceae bacterium]